MQLKLAFQKATVKAERSAKAPIWFNRQVDQYTS